MKRITTWSLVALTVVVPAGCGKKPPQAAPAPAQTAVQRPSTNADADAQARRRAEEEARRRAEEEARRTRATLEEMAFFDYDQAALRPDARTVLDAKVPILRQDGSIRLQIEGHADDRGSSEYNIALGMRRAQAVKDYLTGFGIDGGRFSVISYGEERPLVTGGGEGSWARNRRAAFEVSGGSSIVAGAGN